MATPLTIAQALLHSLKLHNISDTPRLDAELLLSAVSGYDRTYLFTWPEREISHDCAVQFLHFMDRRLAGEPIAHILGQREFWSLPLKVNASTLIPRPDTEILVATALQYLPENSTQICFDLGTGTGAIALAIASERPETILHAIDASADAIALAKENARSLAISNVSFEQASWNDLSWWQKIPASSVDMLVSNPPYIDKNDPHLAQGDVRFEPLSALIAEKNGLADIEFIIDHSRHILKNKGWIWFEHGFEQADKVKKMLQSMGFVNVETRSDYGGNPRVTGGQYDGFK